MEKQGGQYSQYLLYLLTQMLRGSGKTFGDSAHGRRNPADAQEAEQGVMPAEEVRAKDAAASSQGWSPFACDETHSSWRREEQIALLLDFCREGYAMAKKYGHFLIGQGQRGENYIAIPGRFLVAEQPAGGSTGFCLWQPLRGGEAWYAQLDMMEEETAEAIYGYWIARLDPQDLSLHEV